MIEAAGTDISYWFDERREPRTKVNPDTAETEFYCPKGEYLQLRVTDEIKWWKDKNYIVGKLTRKSRKINIVNMLTDHATLLNVPEEETIN